MLLDRSRSYPQGDPEIVMASLILKDLSDFGVYTVGVKDTCAKSKAQPIRNIVASTIVKTTVLNIFSHLLHVSR